MIALPSDVIDVFTSFLDVKNDTATLFSFMLVCKQWSAVAVQAMVRWYAALFDEKGKYRPGDAMDNLTRAYNAYHDIDGFQLPRPAEITDAFCVAHYHHWHMARLVRAWGLVLPEEAKPREGVIHDKFALKGLEVRDAFYWDAEKSAFRPLKFLPGLRTVDLPFAVEDMLELVEKDLARQLLAEPEAQRPLARLKNKLILTGLHRCAVKQLRTKVVALMGAKLQSHKPHKTSPLRNAVLNGKHLLTRKVHRPLQLCIHRYRNLSMKKRAAILTLDQVGEAVALRLDARRRAMLPPEPLIQINLVKGYTHLSERTPGILNLC